MSLTALAVTVATGLCGGYVFVRRWAKARRSKPPRSSAATAVENPSRAELRLGDVVGIGDQEYWLTSGYAVREAGHELAAVFSAEASRLVQTFGAGGMLYLGYEVSLLLPGELPSCLEHADRSFALKSRIPVDVAVLGRENEQPKTALWGCYEASVDETLWVLRTPDHARGIVTRRVPERDIFRWGSASGA